MKNLSLLREWLNLPPGPWPPTDRELLGMTETGPADAATVELKALERMDILRPHQLRNAELVTEGMNRLAQALIALTAGESVAPTVPKKQKKVAREQTPLEIRKPSGEVRLDFDGPIPTKSVSPPKPSAILDAEVIGNAIVAVDVIPESYAVQADEPTVPTFDEPIAIPEPPPGTVVAPSLRRNGYREIALIRRFQDALRKLRPLLGDPGEQLRTPAKIAAYLEAIIDVRAALHSESHMAPTFPDLAGHILVSVVCHPVPLSLLRDLDSSQRRVLARDWAVAEAEMDAKAVRMRKAMTRSRHSRPLLRVVREIAAVMRRNPEWILVLLITLAIAIGFLRA